MDSTSTGPKMVKYVNDPCYGKVFNSSNSCIYCYIKRSCESTYKSNLKKQKALKNPVKKKIIEKKYKKTDKYREW
jgi:hypothetical protein